MQNNLESVAEFLPEIVLEMVDIVGFADTEKLIRAFGGISFRFNDGAYYFPLLVNAVGRDSAEKLRHYFHFEVVYIPRCEVALKVLRNQRFKAEFDYLTQGQHLSKRKAMIELCPKYQISDRQGWTIIDNFHSPAIQPHLF